MNPCFSSRRYILTKSAILNSLVRPQQTSRQNYFTPSHRRRRRTSFPYYHTDCLLLFQFQRHMAAKKNKRSRPIETYEMSPKRPQKYNTGESLNGVKRRAFRWRPEPWWLHRVEYKVSCRRVCLGSTKLIVARFLSIYTTR